MATKQDPKSNLLIHSKAKVEFYKTYLERYLRILCLSKHIKNVNIYDVFCGRGIYENGGKGSPIVAFDAITSFFSEWKEKTSTRVSLIVNDISSQNIEKVKNYIESQSQAFCSIRYFNEDVEKMFEKVLKEVSQTKSDTRNIVFIDPYGYKTINKDILFSLMKNGKTEIILFLPISHMHRFTNFAVNNVEEKAQYGPLKKIVNSFFPNAEHPIRTNAEISVMEYIQYITCALRNNNNYYSTSYYIERDRANHFALFFISPHIYGFEKILEVKWQLDEQNGKGFKLPEQQGDLFAEQIAEDIKINNAKCLENTLLNALLETKTNKELYEITLKNEFLTKHTIEILTKWQDIRKDFKVIDCKTGKPARKKSFYISYEHYKQGQEPKVNFIIEKQ